jgi:AraC-like DNA-binding protein
MSRPLIFTTTGPGALLGVRFRPGGLSGFFALEAAELTDARVDLTNFWGQLAQEVWHRLDEANPEDRVWILQEVLGARANGRFHTDPFIRHCVARIEAARGGLQIRDLQTSTGLSVRQLERKFARHLGISPKTFARVVRFKGVMAAADRPDPPDWVRLAGDFGFADQPHLVREFKAFSGLTPADYRNAANAQPEDVGFLQDTHAALS